MKTWQQIILDAEEECRRLQPGPDCVGVLLSRPAESLAAARWLFPDADIRITIPSERPEQMEIRFQIPSLTLTDWQTFKRFREMMDRASSASIQPAGELLSVILQFHQVWLEHQPAKD